MSRASLGRGRRVLFVSAAAAALVAAAGGIAYSAIPSAGVIHACYLNGVGSLRVIDTSAGQRCRRNSGARRPGVPVFGSRDVSPSILMAPEGICRALLATKAIR